MVFSGCPMALEWVLSHYQGPNSLSQLCGCQILWYKHSCVALSGSTLVKWGLEFMCVVPGLHRRQDTPPRTLDCHENKSIDKDAIVYV